MKKLMMAIVAFTAVNASAELVTVTVCGRGESGNVCEQVTYNVRPASPAAPVSSGCFLGESGVETACPKTFGDLSWLKKLGKFFKNHGATYPTPIEPAG